MTENFKKSYMLMAIIVLSLALLLFLATALMLFLPRRSRELTMQEEHIILRTAQFLGYEDSIPIWRAEIQEGNINLSDYVRTHLTGSKYLLFSKDDHEFAQDLSYIVYGDYDKSDEIFDALDGMSRHFIIESTLASMDTRFSPVRGFSDQVATQLNEYSIDTPLFDASGYAFGVREVGGSISMDGFEARTDFFVNGALRPGELVVETLSDGTQTFQMTWDVREETAGRYDVRVLLRTSDGRGEVMTGGAVTVPDINIIEKESVSLGVIREGENTNWYAMDAGQDNAYINFVDLSDDIAVALYDLYGNMIGYNDLRGYEFEVLRGQRQVSRLADHLTNVGESSNVFYVRVERSPEVQTSVVDIGFTMVTSREVAVHSDQYLAVLDDVGQVPLSQYPSSREHERLPEQIECRDVSGTVQSYAPESLKFLPINGFLTELSFVNEQTGQKLDIYPRFETGVLDYGYVFADEIDALTITAVATEGYAADIRFRGEQPGVMRYTGENDRIEIMPSRNTIEIQVSDFDGNAREYRLFILSGRDREGFDTQVLSDFPDSYQHGLWLIHNIQPAYRFEAYHTGISWDDLVENQDYRDRNLAHQGSHPNWVKPDSPVYDGTGWMAARREVVEYFLDPRNFLTPVNIFQFETLSFDPVIHTVDGVRDMVRDSFLESDDPDYAQYLYEAGMLADVSPYFLTSRIIQEMGRHAQSKLATGTLEGYEGYYNFYNIGSVPNPSVPDGALINGARFAQWGRNPDEQVLTEEDREILLPWTSPELAIKGGALWIARGYINIGQDTVYFQKFDVIDNEDGLYMHQYAQNVSMPYTESIRYYIAYQSQDMLDAPFLFVIPVYEDLPEYYGRLP